MSKKKTFRRKKHEDFWIEEDGNLIGRVRLKPGGIMWRDPSKHQWYHISIEDFQEFAKKRGTLQHR